MLTDLLHCANIFIYIVTFILIKLCKCIVKYVCRLWSYGQNLNSLEKWIIKPLNIIVWHVCPALSDKKYEYSLPKFALYSVEIRVESLVFK